MPHCLRSVGSGCFPQENTRVFGETPKHADMSQQSRSIWVGENRGHPTFRCKSYALLCGLWMCGLCFRVATFGAQCHRVWEASGPALPPWLGGSADPATANCVGKASAAKEPVQTLGGGDAPVYGELWKVRNTANGQRGSWKLRGALLEPRGELQRRVEGKGTDPSL